MTIRTIESADNETIAGIIRKTLTEFGANKPGTVYYDERTDRLYEEFRMPGSKYFVVEERGDVLGGGGIYPTEGLETGTCELVKLYLSAAARGRGLGKRLINHCIRAAKEMGYKKIYLETMPELIIAIPLYESFGFEYLSKAEGNSGHTGCDIWMIKALD